MQRFAGFFGAIKALLPRLLPDGFCTDVLNMKPGRGDLRPWKTKAAVATVPSGRLTIYRFGRDVANDALYWFTSGNDVDHARSLNALDTAERTVYTGEAEPRVTDNVLGLAGAPYPTSYRTLGVPAPSSAMTATVTTMGSGSDETRYYVDTFVTDASAGDDLEESKPGATTAIITCKSDSVITLDTFAAAPGGSHGITYRRIYCTVVATDGTTEFFRIVQQAHGTSSYVHNGGNTGDLLTTTGYEIPPASLKGIISLWNGMMAGFLGKSIRVCVPYKPHAWPINYEAVASPTVVGLGTFGSTLVVLTTGTPYALSGASPESVIASMEPVKRGHACIAKRSIVSFAHGVVWAAPEGLAYMGSNGPQLLTEGIFTQDDWAAIVPSTIVGCQYMGLYFGFYTAGGQKRGFYINPLNPHAVVFLDTGADAAFFDPISGSMYVLNGTSVEKWDAGAGLMTASATTKEAIVQELASYGVAQVLADAYPVTLTVYADGETRHTVSVPSIEAVPLPDGTGLASRWQVKCDTAVGGVQAVILADDADELSRA